MLGGRLLPETLGKRLAMSKNSRDGVAQNTLVVGGDYT